MQTEWQEYLDISLGKNRPTFRQYKSYLSQGLSPSQVIRLGISKHVIHFYNSLLENRITLNKQKFIDEYLSGKSLEQIANENKISYEDITYLRMLYNIPRLGATFIRRKKNEISISKRQRELIFGSLMGDAKRESINSSVGFVHGTSQQEYLLWKHKELINLVSENSLRIRKYIDKRSGSELIDGRFSTLASTDIENIIKMFYSSGKKEISREILDNLSAFSIAVWYMDDGHTDWFERLKIKGVNASPSYSFCTDSFSLLSCQNIQNWFKEKFGIETRLRERRNKEGGSIGSRVIIENRSADKFVELISPFVLPMFRYKIYYQDYCLKRK